MTFNTRHTFNVNCTMPGDVAKLTRVLESWQPPALFCMNSLNAGDSNNIVVRLRNVMSQWGGKIVYRHFEDGEPELWRKRSPDAHLNMLAGFNAPWAWYNVGNEPVTKEPAEIQRMSDWYAELARKSVQRGIRVILPGGFASGTYNRAELRAFHAMWQAMGEQRHLKADGWNVVMLGSHEYGHVDPRYHTDNDDIYDLTTPARARAHVFKTPADIYDGDPSDNWLILRTENILDIMAEANGVPRDQFEIDVGITECDLDRMPNIEVQHRPVADALDAMQGEKTYGYPKVKRALETLYGKPAAEVMADIWLWEEQVYRPYYRFFAHFTWSDHNDHPQFWRDRYGLGAADDLHAAWTARLTQIGVPPVSTIPALPKPTTAGTGVRARLRTTSSVNVRNAPDIRAQAFSPAPTDKALLTYYPATRRRIGAFDWHWVEIEGGVSGWQAVVYENVYEQYVTPEPVAKTFRNPAIYPHVILDGGKFNAPRDYGHNPTKLQKHEGLDLSSLHNAAQPRVVVAPAAGVVERVITNDPYYGIYVRLWHGDGYRAYYAHLERALVTVGQQVAEGDPIGHEGATGNASGNHLHWTVQHFGYGLENYVVEDVVDPLPLIRTEPVPGGEIEQLRARIAELEGALADMQAQVEFLKAVQREQAEKLQTEVQLVIAEVTESLLSSAGDL